MQDKVACIVWATSLSSPGRLFRGPSDAIYRYLGFAFLMQLSAFSECSGLLKIMKRIGVSIQSFVLLASNWAYISFICGKTAFSEKLSIT
jgi:hypothetical protein